MTQSIIIQGRNLSLEDIEFINCLMKDNPAWGRSKLSKIICHKWQWYNSKGTLKDMACRALLVKLEKRGFIKLPPHKCARKQIPIDNRKEMPFIEHDTTPITGFLKDLQPLDVNCLDNPESKFFKFLLNHYHYLSFNGSVGQNLKYLISDHKGRPLACCLFGSAAWKTKSRDSFIGWDSFTREKNLHFITNNMRFLILPWVKIYNLASHILGLISK